MTPAPAVPMTAGEAARTFREDRVAWMNNSAPPTSFQEWLTAWFLKHWPAGGAVTGRELQAALHAEEMTVEVSAYSSMLGSFDERLDRAAARLSAPVAFDVEAVLNAAMDYALTVSEHNGTDDPAKIECINDAWYTLRQTLGLHPREAEPLRRHAAAPAPTPKSGVGSSSVGVPAPVVVEVTAEELHAAAYHDTKGSTPWPMLTDHTRGYYRKAAADLNARLRARAGTATAQVVEVTAAQMREAYGGKYDATMAQDAVAADYINAILRSGAPVAEPKALPVTWRDMEEMCIAIPAHGSPIDYWQKRADWLNKKTLRARVGTAGPQTEPDNSRSEWNLGYERGMQVAALNAPQWIARPRTQGGIKTPAECGVDDATLIAMQWGERIHFDNARGFSKYATPDRWCVPFTDIVCERTEAGSAWTADTVPQKGQRVVVEYSTGGSGTYVVDDAPETLANHWNRSERAGCTVLHYFVIPAPPAREVV